uniref:Low-density lipoprotein receptor-related protein 1 n=2 Tax=Cacopsylla melanoneura TaxID=428564 RepID=A0A8D8SCE1_9HEMI
MCATGYFLDTDGKSCSGISDFILFSVNSAFSIMGIKYKKNDSKIQHVLGPLSKVSLAAKVDFHAAEDYIYWADSEHGTISRIHRDGTGRENIVEHFDSGDTVPNDWLTDIAVDWIAQNIYWSDPKQNLIEVSRLNGSYRYVVISRGIDKPSSLAVDPELGYLFWSESGKIPLIARSGLDGKNQTILAQDITMAVNDIALDRRNKRIYWCYSGGSNIIESIDYSGLSRQQLKLNTVMNPVSMVIFETYIYWADTSQGKGSIRIVSKRNTSDIATIPMKQYGDPIKDLKIFSKDAQTGSNPCAVDNGGCAELCLFNGMKAVCACAHGIVAPDGRACSEYDAFLMFSRVQRIDSIHMTDKNDLNSPFKSISNSTLMKNTIELSYDYKRKTLFYSDIQKGTINSVFFNGTNHKVLLDRQGSVEGLAYEYVHNHLFWTCNNDATINKIDLDSAKAKRNIVVKLGQHDKPRGIDIDSCDSRIYWTNWNSHHPSIQRAFFSGYGIESIIYTDIIMPNALSLDHQAEKLYWGDARLDKIERCEYDGSNRILLSKISPLHPFDMAVYGEFIFWTDWVLHAVLRANKYTGEDVVSLRTNIRRPMGIVAVSDNMDACAKTPCRHMNGYCEDICKLDETGQVACACSNGKVLKEDNKTCIINTVCSEHDFKCGDGICIPFNQTCDRISQCLDNSDESALYCAFRDCRPGYFKCNNNKCIVSTHKCNNINDCGDGSDETDCTLCGNDTFRCDMGLCIKKSLRCDIDPDCPDASDEMHCPKTNCTEKYPHIAKPIHCNYTTACIEESFICDGQNDCFDSSDEQNCDQIRSVSPKVNCSGDKFLCKNGNCILSRWRCDGDNDCDDHGPDNISSDEMNCNNTCYDKNLFQCDESNCISKAWVCDGTYDCTDRSDENSTYCAHTECNSMEFRCTSTGQCIPIAWVCDGVTDCSDKSDEHHTQDCLHVEACSEGYFMCLNGRCLLENYYCDGENDCGDGSDEPPTCPKTECDNSTHFQCQNGNCILSSLLCNGANDCDDNSDEDIDHAECKSLRDMCSDPGHFLCSNGLCINESLTCNYANDCGDGSDEFSCFIDECNITLHHSARLCAHQCRDRKIGYECFCNKGFQVHPDDKHLCVDTNECLDRPCAHYCRNTVGSYVCSCAPGYSMLPDGHNCKAASNVPSNLIFTNRYYIREVTQSGVMTIKAHNQTNAVGLDFDWKEQCLYWSDVTNLGSSIKRSCNGSQPELLFATTFPDGLTVDWVGRNLYWCDKGLDTIEVSRLDGKFRKVLINKGLQEPRAIALDPAHGYMYWTDWGDHAHIGKAQMDGTDPKVIISKNVSWPNGLTISYETNELFWADAKEDYVAVSDLNGENIKIIVSRRTNPSVNLHHVFAIAVFEDHLFWTDWELKTIEKCDKYTATNCTSLVKPLVHKPMDIRVYHPYRQKPLKDNPCENNGGCQGLCLLKPNGRRKCTCPENFILNPDEKTCRQNCSSGQFVCETTMKCIPFWWKCDTQDDCGDKSDEHDQCPKFHCVEGQFQCNNTKCLHPTSICDGINNCGDNSDELRCDEYTCLNTQFKCKGGSKKNDFCISLLKRCNGIRDCPLGEDEQNCLPKKCPPELFRCNSGLCIPLDQVCDGNNDCLDNSDEPLDCASHTCKPNQLRCDTGRCIPKTWKCDGDIDCPNREDEPKSCADSKVHTCEPTYFKCNNSKCIPGRWRCDYDSDCGDGSDEINCTPRNCSESEFQCNNGRCIRAHFVCNGENNCADHSDEADCPVSCTDTEFKCSNPGHCIDALFVCDGDVDCVDGSDEANCTSTCKANEFTCANHQCISLNWRCDGEPDCYDNSDEIESNCAGLACEPNRFKCRNNKCIHRTAVCDGIDNCGDNSDEHHCPGIKLCSDNNFKCANGNCIRKELECDQYNDCGDNSDEEGCDSPLCKFRTCSQICIEKKINKTEKTFSCHCAEGYHMVHTRNKTTQCVADGNAALLLIADANFQVIDPYATRFKGEKSPLDLETTRIYSVDLIYNNANSVMVFWVDRHAKVIKMASMTNNNVTRVKRETKVETILSNLQDPRGVAVDWVGRNLYWTDAGVRGSNNIMVSTLEGRKKRTLLKTGLNEPYDIALEPLSGRMFWTELGIKPRISGASMDGRNKFNLVDSAIQWPTGITIDYPSQRLYWADPKAKTIESINLNGKDRFVVYHTDDNGHKPYKLEVFEDSLYFSTYRTNNILKINKFGKSDVTVLANNLLRASDILIIQENKQAQNVSNSCKDNPCHQSALCITLPSSHTCLCPDHLTEEFNMTSGKMICKVTPTRSCSLDCNHGTCELDDDQEPHCVCLENFYGSYCERVNNSMCPCLNQGMCYQDLSHAETPYKCHCAANFTGDRCEIRICENKCHNGGTCIPTTQTCVCTPGYTGDTCQQCVNLLCQNGGVCVNRTKGLECECPKYYNGKFCQYPQCNNYCNNGVCSITESGPECQCYPGYTGKTCDTCLCQNGGTCVPISKTNICKCPVPYGGRLCNIVTDDGHKCSPLTQKCTTNFCVNNGTCVMKDCKPSCKCVPPWSGDHCEEFDENHSCHNYCENSGVCSFTPQGKPVCTCVNGWSGVTCSERVSCAYFCFNGGTCKEQNYSLDPDLKPVCICPAGYAGVRCQTLVNSIPRHQSYVNSHISTLLILLLLFITVCGIVFYIVRFKRRAQFMHMRMPENIEISNPMYLREDIDDENDILERNFAIDTDRGCSNFENPVYESMYNAKLPAGSEEKKGLLHELQERVRDPLTSSAERL